MRANRSSCAYSDPSCRCCAKRREEVQQALKDIPGLIDLHVEQQVEVPQIQVKLNLEAAARHGLKPGDVRRVVSALMSGIEVTDIHREGKVYDVWVWSLPSIASQRGEHPRVSDRHALWRARASGGSGGRRARADAEQDQARKQLAAHRRSRQRQRPRSGLGGGRSRGPARKNAVPDRVLPAAPWGIQGASGCAEESARSSRSPLRSRSSSYSRPRS